MGRDSMRAKGNMCFECRIRASKYNDTLKSREGASEQLGVSVSSLAEYETGITKVVPVDKIVLMADLYNAPELELWYCSEECPVGRHVKQLPSYDFPSVEVTTLRLLDKLRKVDVETATDSLIHIMADGIVSEDEKVEFNDIMAYLDELIKAASQLRLIGSKISGGKGNEQS